MHHFVYRHGVLHAEAVNLIDLAQAVATPFYCYSTATLWRHYEVFASAFSDVSALICYAMKANSNQAVIKTLASLGAGADVVSEGELKRALAAGIAPNKLMFSGIGKTAAELALAVDEGILFVNVESDAELELLSSIATSKGRNARIAVRVNPDIDPKTHAKIATGKAENKFGIPISRAREVYAKAAKLPGLEVTGVDMHIGSQITELEPFDDAFALLSDFVRTLRADGHAISHLDLGGGLGIPYREDNEPPLNAARIIADVAGPVCESGDFLALEREMAEPRPGDLLAVMTAGAYGAVQAGTYNTRALVPEVLVRENEWALVRPRLETADLIALDRLPPWL